MPLAGVLGTYGTALAPGELIGGLAARPLG